MNYRDDISCIEACLKCASVCQHCANMDLKEGNNMSKCVQINMECAVACLASAQLMSLGSGFMKAQCKVCAELCRACAEECEKYDNAHCRECAEACRNCEKECRKMAK